MFLVYTDLDVDLKGITLYNTLKEKTTNKNNYADNYSAFHIRDCTLSLKKTFLR